MWPGTSGRSAGRPSSAAAATPSHHAPRGAPDPGRRWAARAGPPRADDAVPKPSENPPRPEPAVDGGCPAKEAANTHTLMELVRCTEGVRGVSNRWRYRLHDGATGSPADGLPWQ